MRIATCLMTVFVGGVLICQFATGEETSYRAKLSYSELLSYGMISAYSTNVLVQIGFGGRALTKTDALDAVERNLAFVKVLQRYTYNLRRSLVNEGEGMKKMIADMCDVSTYLEEQTVWLKNWINDPESKSAKLLYDGYRGKVEKLIEEMLKK